MSKKKLKKKFTSNPINLEQYAVCKNCYGQCLCYCSTGYWNLSQIDGKANGEVHDFELIS